MTVPVDQSTARETLYEAARLVGGLDNLSRIVDTKKAHLVAYGAGLVAIPQGLFLKLADVVTEHTKLNPTTVSLGEQHAIVQRIFLRAAERIGGASALCQQIKVPYSELRTYLQGDAMPPEDILLRAVDVIIDELPTIRSGFSQRAWQSLALPR